MNPVVTAYLLVALGSMVGGCSRYALAGVFDPAVGAGVPWGTIVVNITGCFVIGFAGTYVESPNVRLLVLTGLCGGYTTFSAFSFQTLKLYESGRTETALANVAISLVTCLIAVWLGMLLARAVMPAGGITRP